MDNLQDAYNPDSSRVITHRLTFWENGRIIHAYTLGVDMKTFYYTQTVVYSLQVEADSAEAADAIAYATEVDAIGVVGEHGEWQEDGYAETE